MQRMGSWVVIGMFALALGATLFAQWYHYASSRRTLAYFGTEAGSRISRAERVELLELAPAGDAAATSAGQSLGTVAGQNLAITRRIDVSESRDLRPFRLTLLADSSYGWDEPTSACEGPWNFAIRFGAGDDAAVLAFATECGRVVLVGKDEALSSAKTGRDTIEAFLRQAEAPARGTHKPDTPARGND